MFCISSMATRQLLAELVAGYAQQPGGAAVKVESVGGVDAAKRVRAGEAFDLVVLASDVIDKLIAEGFLQPGSRVDIARSEVAVAVKAGAAKPAIDSEEALKAAVLAASSIGYSTGPSGTALLKLFERWGISEQLQGRLVQATAGVPVGTLVANGEVALGFQQLSELLHLQGIDVLGLMPAPVQVVTVFSGGVGVQAADAKAAAEALRFMGSDATAEAKQRQGMAAA